LLLEGLPPISVPEFLGFRLDSLRLSRVTTPEDDFLAIHATLGASQTLMRLAGRFHGLARATAAMAAPAVRRTTARGSARLVRVTTPPPAAIRAHLHGQGGAMPEVVIDVPASDSLGRELEWTWNLGGGMWRPFRPGGRLVLTDGAFAMQGRYEIELRSRVAGDYRTLSLEPDVVPIVIDSVGPRILGERVALDRDSVVIPAFDLVSPVEKVQLAFGRAGDEEPATGWGPDRLSVAMAKELAAGSGQLAVWARDELGNQSSAMVGLGGVLQFHAQEEQGCACATGGSGGAGGLGLLGLAALIGLGRRGWRGKARRAGRLAALILAGGALASQPACSCGNSGDDDAGGEDDDGGTEQPVCESDPECAAECEPGSVPLCDEGECACEDDVRWGRIGQFSEMDVAADGTVWVSAYNSYHGDLMIAARSESGRIPDEAWEFVDGVPDGPVLVPDSDVRGGVNEPGPDVGLYTDIAAAGDGAVVASYFDQDGAGLKLAGNRSGAWSSHVIDPGVPAPEEPTEGATYEIAGQYSAIAMRADGVPGVAYFAHVADAKGERTELRFAEASSPDPTGEADWTVTVVDSAAVPEPGGDPLPIPMGVGLFVNAARLSDGSPVLVYYDRVNGDLKLARFDATAGSFTLEVLDGDGVDVGWYPAVAVDPATDVVHVSYVSASNNDLHYVNTADRVVEVIDDGYRIAGETDGGLPIPEFHFVGDDSGLVLGPAGPIVAYQDATSHELLVAERDPAAGWTRETVAGDEDPFAGGYGFYISAKLAGDQLVLSTWVIDQPNETAWVEILREAPPVE
ncbi:MAG TPA: hypothetical protein VNO33_07100, partial [Kofleriaceae bacterium]|nr:hypothetical protein [Kofleriaceae bacterium]